MSRLATTLLAAMLACSIPSALAFSASLGREVRARMALKSLNYRPQNIPENIPQTYDRALDCANNFGLCGIDELLDLSEELDEFLGCYVDDSPEACEEEIDGRHDLSEALLVQSEMMERDQYVQEGNVFPFDTSGGDEPMGGQEYWGSTPNPSGLAP